MTDAAAKPPRTRYTYTIPGKLLGNGSPDRRVGLVPLSMRDEMKAIERCRGVAERVSYEYATLAIASVDGKPVDPAQAEAEAFLEAIGPQARALVLRASNRLHNAPEDVVKGFLEQVEIDTM